MPGTVYINPAVMADKRDAMAVAVNEALRVAMEDLRFSPAAALTPEQKRMLAGTAYEGDEDASRKTVAARIATFDSSVAPTPEQKEETLGFLNLLAEALGPSHRDAALVAAIVSALGASEAPGGEPPAGPVPEDAAEGRPAGTARDAAKAGDVDWHSLPPVPSKGQLWGLSMAVAEAMPGLGNAERFLYETAGAESDWGAHPDTFRKGYHGGVFQVDRKGFEDTLATESHRKNLRRHYDTIKKAFGVDWTTVKYEDIRDKPLLGALAARLLIANKPDPVPGDAEGRARYWKRHYNSYHENAKGTVEEYLKRNGFPLPSGFKE